MSGFYAREAACLPSNSGVKTVHTVYTALRTVMKQNTSVPVLLRLGIPSETSVQQAATKAITTALGSLGHRAPRNVEITGLSSGVPHRHLSLRHLTAESNASGNATNGSTGPDGMTAWQQTIELSYHFRTVGPSEAELSTKQLSIQDGGDQAASIAEGAVIFSDSFSASFGNTFGGSALSVTFLQARTVYSYEKPGDDPEAAISSGSPRYRGIVAILVLLQELFLHARCAHNTAV